jgi:hypothetical protein
MLMWILLLVAAAVLSGLGLTVVAMSRLGSTLREASQKQQAREGTEAALLEAKLRELAAAQNQIAGRFTHAIESQEKSQAELQRAVAERLEALDKRLGDNLKDTAAKTAETLGGLQTRLSVIDEAQKNLTDLSGQVVSLQQILANKQARGAWGQGQMEAIIRDALPPFALRIPGNAFEPQPSRLPDPHAWFEPGHCHRFQIPARILFGLEISPHRIGTTRSRAARARRYRQAYSRYRREISHCR